MYTHTHKKTVIIDTCEHQSLIQYSNGVSTRLSEAFHLAFFSHPHTYRLHLLHMYRNCSASESYTFTAFPKLSPSVWQNFLLSSCSHLFLSHTPTHPQTYLIAPRFIFDPRCCHVKLCFCFVDVMTMASTILMMWLRLTQCEAAQWNWWKDLAHWLSLLQEQYVCACVCVPLCRVLYHYWRPWNT